VAPFQAEENSFQVEEMTVVTQTVDDLSRLTHNQNTGDDDGGYNCGVERYVHDHLAQSLD